MNIDKMRYEKPVSLFKRVSGGHHFDIEGWFGCTGCGTVLRRDGNNLLEMCENPGCILRGVHFHVSTLR